MVSPTVPPFTTVAANRWALRPYWEDPQRDDEPTSQRGLGGQVSFKRKLNLRTHSTLTERDQILATRTSEEEKVNRILRARNDSPMRTFTTTPSYSK